MHENLKCCLQKLDLDLLVYLKSFWDMETSNSDANYPLIISQLHFPMQTQSLDKLPLHGVR